MNSRKFATYKTAVVAHCTDRRKKNIYTQKRKKKAPCSLDWHRSISYIPSLYFPKSVTFHQLLLCLFFFFFFQSLQPLHSLRLKSTFTASSFLISLTLLSVRLVQSTNRNQRETVKHLNSDSEQFVFRVPHIRRGHCTTTEEQL